MAYIDVGAWSPEHVIHWFEGLHTSLKSSSMDQILLRRINGSRLMMLTALDLIEMIPSIKIEALQAILRGISLLNYLNHSSRSETLQSLTLNLACQARYLYNQLIQAEHSPRLLPVSTTLTTPMTGNSKNRFDFAKVDSNMQINQSTKQRVSLETLDSVSIIVDQILQVVSWLNSIELTSRLSKFNKDFKSIVLRVAVELTSTAQRDQFVDQPNDIIKKTSKFLADYCEWVVLAIDDPDFIQPCLMDVVSVKRKADEEDFGIIIQPSSLGLLTIEEVVFSSPAHRSGRVSNGDELIQVDYQTVVSWPHEEVKELIKTYTSEIILTIKKRPTQSSLNPSIIVVKPYAIPLKRIVSQNLESDQSTHDDRSTNERNILQKQQTYVDGTEGDDDEAVILEPPKEPKGPYYPEIQTNRTRRELRRRMSISGSISDALVDLSLADSLPIPSLEKTVPRAAGANDDQNKSGRMSKETLTKSVSHDTAKLYLHTLSIDRKHLWLPKSPKVD